MKKISHTTTLVFYMLAMFAYSEDSSEAIKNLESNTKDSATLSLSRSSKENDKRSLWIVDEGKKELVWEGIRKEGYSIATNRGVDYRLNEIERQSKENINSPTSRQFFSEEAVNYKNKKIYYKTHKIEDPSPDPYENMEIIKATRKGDTLVAIFRLQCPEIDLAIDDPSYAGGYFYAFSNPSRLPLQDLEFAPHSNYSHFNIRMGDVANFKSFKAPWSDSHGGYEYFLRSYLKNELGEWKIHMSAAISTLWANSMSLPIKSLDIENENTYSVTFDGMYEYFSIDAEEHLKKIINGFNVKLHGLTDLFDYYGGIEKYVYKGEVLKGETVEKITLKDSEGHKDFFNNVYTTFNGSEDYYRIAHEKESYSSSITSWHSLDELSDEQVSASNNNEIDQVPAFLMIEKVAFSQLPARFKKLKKHELRQTFTLDIEDAKLELEKKIESKIEKISIVEKSGSKANNQMLFSLERQKLYLRLINEELNK